MVQTRSRSPLVVLAAVVVALSISVTMLLPRASAFLMQPRMAAVAAATRGRQLLRMGLDRSSRPTPRGPKFEFRRFSSSGDDFAAINPQTLNWEKVGPEEDVFISALSQNGHVNVKVIACHAASMSASSCACMYKARNGHHDSLSLTYTTDRLLNYIGRLGQKLGGRHAEEARTRGRSHGDDGARHAERDARGARREGTFLSCIGPCVVEC